MMCVGFWGSNAWIVRTQIKASFSFFAFLSRALRSWSKRVTSGSVTRYDRWQKLSIIIKIRYSVWHGAFDAVCRALRPRSMGCFFFFLPLGVVTFMCNSEKSELFARQILTSYLAMFWSCAHTQGPMVDRQVMSVIALRRRVWGARVACLGG